MNIIRYKTLKNGLRIVGEEVPYVRSICMGVWINVGSRMEDDTNSGIAHFIEHMLFKGTENRTAKQISNSIDYYGGDLNAFTDQDNTCYYVNMPYNHIDTGIDVLSDILINSLFSPENIEKEKSVISEEIRMYEDSTEDYVYEQLMKLTYDNKGIGRKILGTIESVSEINREKITEFFRRYYTPNNSVICISGNFKFDDICRVIEEKFSHWEKNEVEIKRQGQVFKPVMFLEDKDDEQANIAILFQCPSDEIDREFYAVKLISNILGKSTSSRLFQKIREEEGLAYSIYSSANFYVGFGEFGIFASCAPENVREVYNHIVREVVELKTKYITEEELVFSKEQYKGKVFMDVEDTEDKMMLIGDYEINGKRVPEIEDVIRVVDSIDMEFMRDMIDRIFTKPMSVGITGRNVEKIMKSR